MLKKRRRKSKRKKRTNKNKQGRENYKEIVGTKLKTNTKKQNLKIQSRVWNFRYTIIFKRIKKKENKKGSQKLLKKKKQKTLQVQN